MGINDRFGGIDLENITATEAELNKLAGSKGTAATSVYLTAKITDISTSGSTFVVCPVAGDIAKIETTIKNAITVGDAALTFELGGVSITGGAITVAQSGSAAGDVDSATPTAANTVTAGQAIEIITDGGSTDACECMVTFTITPS